MMILISVTLLIISFSAIIFVSYSLINKQEQKIKRLNEKMDCEIQKLRDKDEYNMSEIQKLRDKDEYNMSEIQKLRDEHKYNMGEIQKLREEQCFNTKNNEVILDIYNFRLNSLEKDNKLWKISYKIIFYRKLANSILNIVVNKDEFMSTSSVFEDETKPEKKKTKFYIIHSTAKDENIRKKRNLAIDFLYFISDRASEIIHISDKTYFIQFQYILEDLKESPKINSNGILLNCDQIISLLFDSNIEEESNIQESIVDKIVKINSGDKNDAMEAKINNNIRILNELKVKELQKSKYDIINIKKLFQEWKLSFTKLKYKTDENFKKIVELDEKMEIEEMKEILKEMLKGKSIDLYQCDVKNFDVLFKKSLKNF